MKTTLIAQTVKNGVITKERVPVSFGSGKTAYLTVGDKTYLVDKVIADRLKAFLDGDIDFFTVQAKEG